MTRLAPQMAMPKAWDYGVKAGRPGADGEGVVAIYAVKNRYAAEPFVGMWDGQTYIVQDELLVPDHVAYHLKKQSVVRDNPYDPSDNQYRLWIVGVDQDPGPLEELPVETMVRDDGDPRWRKTTLIRSNARPAAPQHRETFGALDVGQAAKG